MTDHHTDTYAYTVKKVIFKSMIEISLKAKPSGHRTSIKKEKSKLENEEKTVFKSYYLISK